MKRVAVAKVFDWDERWPVTQAGVPELSLPGIMSHPCVDREKRFIVIRSRKHPSGKTPDMRMCDLFAGFIHTPTMAFIAAGRMRQGSRLPTIMPFGALPPHHFIRGFNTTDATQAVGRRMSVIDCVQSAW